ncbi:pre-peptidase C-terminal domain-containing protein [Cupriavidus sp. SIMBA_020]|uniref:pre-peptidase C-terminal domain-containing protein n=1 Tax=Cupriavidus sp. SIMBA_020 TaxID=3085766 RepID=UPI00397ADF7A
MRAWFSFSSAAVARTVGVLAICSALFAGGLGYAANTGFVYDDLGRLIQVVAPDGTSTQYAYDAVGNITAVRADGASTLTVASFSPGSGPAGTNVTLFGNGFSTVPSANSVKFNGAAAVVTAASATTLQVAVPAGATTGTISVSNTNGTAVSARDFVVGVGSTGPTITGFTPSLGLAGTAVTMTGTGFQPTTSGNTVVFGAAQGAVTGVTAPSQIVATVPQAGSGKVSITTVDGTAVSADDFYVVPAGAVPSTIVAAQRIVPDGPAVTPILGTAGSAALLMFDAVAGQRLGLGLASFQATPASGSPQLVLSVYSPSGASLVSCTVTTVNKCTLPVVPKTGTYRVLARVDSTHTANISLLLTSEHTGVLTADAPVTTFATSRVGQNGRYTFGATAGQNLNLAWSGGTFAGTYSYLYVYGPSGSLVTSQYFSNAYSPNGVLQLTNLQQSGTYTVVVDPYQASIGQVGLQLMTQTSGTLIVDGEPLAISQMAGATGRYTFEGTAGQRLGLGLDTLVTTPNGGSATVTVVAPDNATTLVGCGSVTVVGASCNLPSLPSTGTYTVVVTPSTASTALGGKLTLSADVKDTLAANAPATTFATNRAGQNGRYTFSATAGQSLSLVWSGATFAGGNTNLYVYAPNGDSVASQYFNTSSSSGTVQLTNLQQSGTYTVLIDPYAASLGQVGVQLLAPATGTLAVDGEPLAISQMAGASGRYKFEGVAGQRLGLGLDTLVATPGGGSASVAVVSPDGVTTLLNCSTFSAPGNSCNLPLLPSTGTYTVVVAPSGSSTALSGNLTLSSDVSGTLTANDPVTTFTTGRAGQNGRYTFSATAGQSLSLTWSGATLAGSTGYLYVYAPNGSTVASSTSVSSGAPNGLLQLNNLQQSGTYTVFVDPYLVTTGRVGLQLLAPTTGTLTVDGDPLAISQMAGASGRYTFAGVAGQRLGLGLDALVITPSGGYATVTVMSPDNVTTLVSCENASAPGNSCNLPPLPSTDTYTVIVTSSSSNRALNGNLTLSADTRDTLTANAPVTTFATTRAGQNGRYTFTANAGDNLSLAWSGATFSGTYGYLYVYAPNGTTLASQSYVNSGTPNGMLQMNNLQQSGTYTVVIDPYQANTGRVGLQLLAPASGTLTVDGEPLVINQMTGAAGRYTFAGVAGQRLGLGLDSLVMTPSGGSATVAIMSPDNVTTLINCGSFPASSSCNLPSLPSTDTYTVVVTPSNATIALSGRLTLSADIRDTLTANAPMTTFATNRVGQNGRLTFSATAGQDVNLVWSGATFAGGYTYMYVYAPNGDSLTSQYFSSTNYSSGSVQLSNLQQSGSYTIVIDPYAASTGQVGLRLLAPISGTLAVDGEPLAISQAAGVPGRYSFAGVAGQRLGLGLDTLVTTPGGGYASVVVVSPDGVTTLLNCNTFSVPGNSCNLPSLPSTGTYTVVVSPSGPSTALSGNLTLSSDISGTLTANDPVTTFATARAGQNGRYTFSATAGQSLSLAWSGATLAGSTGYLYVYAPNGSTVASSTSVSSGTPNGVLQLSNLQQSGTYTVLVEPYLVGTGQVGLQLLAPATGTLTVDGERLAINQTAGVSGRYTFAGISGQRLGLGLDTFATAPGGGSASVTVISPDNVTTLAGCDAVTAPGNSCNLPALPSTGTYTVVVTPSSANRALSGNLILSTDVAGTLSSSPYTFHATRPGQNGRFTFTADAGDNITISTIAPTIGQSNLVVYGPTANLLLSRIISAGTSTTTYPLNDLQQSGTFTLVVDPMLLYTGDIGLTVVKTGEFTPPEMSYNGVVTVDGAPLAISQLAGTTGRYVFEGVAGQSLSLGLDALAVTPSGSYASVVVMAPDNVTALISCGTFYAPGNSCSVPTLPSTGTYTVVVTPINSTTALSGNLLVSADIRGTLTANGPVTTFTTTRLGQNARYTFSATAGQNFSLAWSGATFVGAYTNLYVYGPNGSTVTSQPFSSTYIPNGALQLSNLQQSGTYTVVVDPYPTSTGRVGLQLLAPASGTLTVDGPPLAISLTAGAAGRYTFEGVAGQRLGLGYDAVVVTPTGGNATVMILSPDNVTALVTCDGVYAAGNSCNLPSLPSTGIYTVVVTPSSSSTVLSGNLTLSADVRDTLTANAPATIFSTSRAGQNGRYTFSATAGDSMRLAWIGATFAGSSGYLYVYGPNGSTVASNTTVSSGTPSGVLQLNNLQQSGTYTVVVDPYSATTGRVGLQLLASAGGTLAVDDVPLAINQIAGAAGRYTFAGVAGQRLGLGLDSLVTTPGGGTAAVTVIAPDNVTTLVSCSTFSAPGNSCNLPSLPSTGTYTVVVTPGSLSTALSGKLTLSADIRDTLTVNAPATTFATSRAGQNGRYTFSATAGQNLSLAWSGATFVGSYTYLYVYGPNGSILASPYFSSASSPSGNVQLTNLQQSGTYTVVVDPYAASTGQVGLQLLAPASGTLAVDGEPLVINQVAGASGRYAFAGTAGQRLGLGLDAMVTTPAGGYASVTIVSPDELTTLVNCSTVYAPGNSCNLPSLPSTGTYTVVVTPSSSGTTLAGKLTLSADVVDTLTANAPVTTFATGRAGQNGRFTFTATAGQDLSLAWTGTTFVGNYTSVYVYAPNGTSLTSQSVSSTYLPVGSVQLTNLQQSGTYTVVVDPYQAAVGQIGLQLLATAGGTLTVDGEPLAINQLAGATGRYTFAGVAGQRVGLGLDTLSLTPSGGYATIVVLAPDDVTTLVSCENAYVPGNSCNLPALPSTGTYTIVVTPPTSRTAVTGNLTLSTDVRDALTANAPVTTFVANRVGLNGRYTFTATAGQNLSLIWTGATLTGSSGNLYVYAPNGTTVASNSYVSSGTPSGTLQLSNLQQSGTYTVVVDPVQVSTGTVGLQLVAPASGTLTVDGEPLAISQIAGAAGRYTFEGVVGQRLGLGMDSLVATPSGGYASVTVMAPDNVTTLITCSAFRAPGNNCNLPSLPSTGTYTVVVTPSSLGTALSSNLMLSTEIRGTLTANDPVTTFATNRVAQSGRYTFSATAGQNLTLAWSGATFVGSYTYLYVYAPNGSTLATANFSSTNSPNGVVQLNSLQQSGTYTIVVDPYEASTGQVGLQLLAPATGTLTVEGDPLAINQVAGASGRYTFAGTAGDFLNLGLSSAAITPAGSTVTVTVISPDNVTTLVNCGSFSGSGSCSVPALSSTGANNSGLPSTGTYTVVVTPGSYATTVSGSLSLKRFSLRP